MNESNLIRLAEKVGAGLCKQTLQLTTAESCTGGYLAQMITAIPGSSQWFERGFVTYSNQAKHEMLGVALNVLQHYGAVSPQVATAMAQGALTNSQADVSVAITGIAGPEGGSATKPVGLVYFAWASTELVQAEHIFSGDRHAVRYQATEFAMEKLLTLL